MHFFALPWRNERASRSRYTHLKMPRWAPNFFTCLRLILAPFVVYAIWTRHPTTGLLLFVGAAFTDVVDGALARRFRLASPTGAYLDPIADKLLLSGVFIALAGAASIPWWLVGLVLGRDLYILMAVGVFLWLTPVRQFPPSSWGKTSTFVQVVTVVAWMAQNVLGGPVLTAFSVAMLWPCAAFTIVSGLHYTWRGVQLARAH